MEIFSNEERRPDVVSAGSDLRSSLVEVRDQERSLVPVTRGPCALMAISSETFTLLNEIAFPEKEKPKPS
jgi:hypothetical protein